MNNRHFSNDANLHPGVHETPFLLFRVTRRFAFLAAAAVCALISGFGNATAQNYSIDWHTLDGGGGDSAGGIYSLSGTVGQPDAGRISSVNTYSLAGGFWGAFDTTVSTRPHGLRIESLPGGTVRLFWGRPADGRVLQEALFLGNPGEETPWADVAPSVYQTNATTISYTVSPPGRMGFYRLR
jgi:hypothetical protein